MKSGMKVHCFYHRADLDGHCSGAIVRRWCQRHGHEFVPHGVNYGEKIDWMAGAGPDGCAVVVDFTPEGDGGALVLAAMKAGYAGGLVWIDHHETAIMAVERHGETFDGLQQWYGPAACVLTWQWFFRRQEGERQEEMPNAVELLGAYDVFDRADGDWWKKHVLPFQYGMRAEETDPARDGDGRLWAQLLNEEDPFPAAEACIKMNGKTIISYERKQNGIAAKSAGYDCEFEGLLCCAMNGRGNSLVLDAYARPEHKMRILWAFTGGRWRVSLFENGHDDVHCGEIARRHGGGGHKGAAGFEISAGDGVGLVRGGLFAPVKRADPQG